MATKLPATTPKLPARVCRDLDRYLATEWRGGAAAVQLSDVVLALLRLGHREQAERVMGKPIAVYPAYVPPWPPAPVAQERPPRVTRRVSENPCAPKSDAHKRFAQIRVGMTLAQLESRGISKRDVRVWKARGYIGVGA